MKHGTLGPKPHELAAIRVLGRMGAGGVLRRLGMLEQAAAEVFDFIPYTPLFNVTGQPAMSVPLHWSAEGLPIGVQAIGPPAGDAMLLSLAAEIESARPWSDRRPPLS